MIRPSRTSVICSAIGLVGLSLYCGCATTPQSADQPANVGRADYDPDRALLRLDQIKPDPAPPEPSAAPEELSEPAARRLSRAEELYQRQRFTESALELEKALRREPNDPRLHRQAAKVLYAAGSLERVRAHLQQAVALRDDDIVTHYLLGRVAFDDGNNSEAIRQYRIALKCDNAAAAPAYIALTHFHLARVLNAERFLTAAIESYRAYERAVAGLPTEARSEPDVAHLLQINGGNAGEPISVAYEKLGRFGDAADALASTFGDRSPNADTTERLARLLAHAGRFEEALERARTLLDDTDRATRLLVEIHERAGHPERVIDDIRGLYENHPDRADLLKVYVDVLVRFQRLDEAQRVLVEGLERHPERQELRWRLCDVLLAKRQWRGVLDVAAEALRRDPDDHPTCRAKVLAMAEHEDAVAALLGPNDAAAPTQSDAASASLLGSLAVQVGRVEPGEALLAASLSQRPDLTPARAELAELLLGRFAWQEAIDLVSADPDQLKHDSRLETLCGRAYAGLDDFEKAEAHLGAAVRLDRTNLEAMRALAQVLRDKGDTLRAEQQYKAIVEINPLDEASRESLFEIHLFEQQDRRSDAADQLAELRRLSASPHRIARCAARLDLDPNPRNADWAKYRKALQDAIDRAGPDAKTYELIAQSYLFEDQPGRALEAFQRAAEINPGDSDIALGCVLARAAMLDYDGQIEGLRELLKRHPNRRAWRQRLLEALLVDQRFDEAMEWARTQLKRTDLSEQEIATYRDGIREALAVTKQYDALIEALHEWRAQDPGNGDLTRVLVAVYGMADRHDDAIAVAEAYHAREPGPETRDLLWRTLMVAERYGQAQRFLLGLLEDDPENESLNSHLVNTLKFGDRPDDALELLENERYGSGEPFALREEELQVLEAARRFDEAIKQCTKWLREVETDVRGGEEGLVHALHQRVALDLIRDGRYDEAAIELNRWAESTDRALFQFEYFTQLSLCHQNLNERDRAIDALRRAYEIREQASQEAHAMRFRFADRIVGLHNDYGYSLADAGLELDEAERMIRYALVRQPRNGAFLDSYGWVLYKKGAFAQAAKWLEKAARALADGDPVVYDHLGDALWRLGRNEEAVRRWKDAVALIEKESEEGNRPDLKNVLKNVSEKIDACEAGGTPTVAPANRKVES